MVMDADEMFGNKKKKTKGSDASDPGPSPEEQAAAAARAAERAETVLWVRGQIAKSQPIAGTPAERYLVQYRGLKGLAWPASLHWAPDYQWRPGASPKPCLLAVVTNAAGDAVAVQSIELDPLTGSKSSRTNTPKMSRGPVSEGAVRPF